MSANAAPVQPVALSERMEVVDVIRGFALLGILMVNMGFFAMPFTEWAAGEWGSTAADTWALRAVRFFAQAKFYSMFSFLFGLGFTIMMDRALARGAGFFRLYTRRLLALLLIGLVHAFVIWAGDILVTYSIMGFLLLLFFRRCRPRTLWITACILLLIPAAFITLVWVQQPGAEFLPADARAVQAQLSYRAFGEGSFGDAMAVRASDAASILSFLPFVGWSILAMFLFGAWAGRTGLFRSLPEKNPFVRKVLWWGLGIGLVGNAIFTATMEWSDPYAISGYSVVGLACQAVGAPALCFFYVAALTLWFQTPSGKKVLHPLASMGRMALTNYLMQSVVGTLLFYNYGLGYYGQVGPAAGLGLTFLIYFLQIPWSVWWLRRFRFGPMEWVWRSLTYARLQPMRVRTAL